MKKNKLTNEERDSLQLLNKIGLKAIRPHLKLSTESEDYIKHCKLSHIKKLGLLVQF